ncbi:Iron-sulfur protein IND1 [Mycena indigotica]|uniref:Iron-sulfur protein IND1 n=1 Tax=Mycena indigotica TaxID=2126181 RepID=A0A8H6W5N0_9AGAR|nr:Iron-sulfur protein IND1 [Mycena indigotica]KAF7303721.1 Iron-sulfur protein IND1 [Mycena indigotica]
MFSTRRCLHENPLGLQRLALPRKATGIPQKRCIPNVKRVVAVASGKGGVGKSTVAVNLAFALSTRKLRVGILDLDIFGPSIPTLMGLQHSEEPLITSNGALIPLMNHGIASMSMGFLLPRDLKSSSTHDSPVVWRGLMVQKAVQQLLFDVDWSNESRLPPLDVLVVDLPPGTGDVPLTLGQHAQVDGAVVVSTPQDVALADVRKGIAMLRKIDIPIIGLVLNLATFLCTSCQTAHQLFGSPAAFHNVAERFDINVLAKLPLVPGVSIGGDNGSPFALSREQQRHRGPDQWLLEMDKAAESVWQAIV